MPNPVVVDVENRSFVRQGPGPITTAFRLRWSDPLSRSGEFSFFMPARDPRADLLSIKNSVVRIFEESSQVFLGVVERLTRSVDSRGRVVLEVAGRHLMGCELVENSADFLQLAAAGSSVTSGPADVLARASYATWTLDTSPPAPLNGYSTTSAGVYAAFAGESCLQALIRISEVTGEHFVASDEDRKIVWLRSAWPASGVRAIQGGADPAGLAANANVCVIEKLEQIVDAHELVNLVFLYGAGQGNARFTTTASTRGSTIGDYSFNIGGNFVNRTVRTVPLSERHLQFPEITPLSNTTTDVQSAANMLVDAGVQWLKWYDEPKTFYRLQVIGLPATVRPGMTIQAIYEDDALSVDAVLYIIEVAWEIDERGRRLATLTIGDAPRWPATDESEITGQLQQGRIFQTNQQLGRSINTLTYNQDFDASVGATLNFWLGTEITQVERVLLRFRVDPLRSTVKTVAGSSTSSGASSASSSGGGGATTTSSANSAGGISGTTGNNLAAGDPHSHNYTLVAHTHDVALPDHTHNIDHTHTFTPSITTTYGLFEDSGGTTITDPVTQASWFINGNALNTGDIDSAGGGWYEIDLTDLAATGYTLVTASTGRPVATANSVTVFAGVGRRGRINAQIEIRSRLQS